MSTTNGRTAAMLAAACEMLVDAMDEARGISMASEEAHELLTEGSPLAALGTMTDFDRRLDALQHAVTSARTLLMRARAKGGVA